jgi:hypothetical protein
VERVLGSMPKDTDMELSSLNHAELCHIIGIKPLASAEPEKLRKHYRLCLPYFFLDFPSFGPSFRP